MSIPIHSLKPVQAPRPLSVVEPAATNPGGDFTSALKSASESAVASADAGAAPGSPEHKSAAPVEQSTLSMIRKRSGAQ